MDFITEEIQTELGLTPEQLNGIKPLYEASLAETKKGWDDLANTNSQAILDGAAALVAKQTGIAKTDGEKLADYFTRSGSEYLKTQQDALEAARTDYETKLKNFKGDEATAAELAKAKEDLDLLMQKTADYDTIKENAEKLTPLQEEHAAMKKRVAWSGVKPSFPEGTNEYEAAAKWAECIANIEKEYNIEFDGEKAVGVNKENKHNIVPLKDLVSKNEDINKLMEGRQQTGINGKQTSPVKIEGVPFDVPKDADTKQITELIRAQIAKEGINITSSQSATRFKELLDKIKQQTA